MATSHHARPWLLTGSQVVHFGMSEQLGQVSFDFPGQDEVLPEKPYCEATPSSLMKKCHAHEWTLDLLTWCWEQGDKVSVAGS